MGRVQPGRRYLHREGQPERREDRQQPVGGSIDAGAGVISTTTGVFTFLLFLLLAVQVTYNLYATTMVTSAAHDAARRTAGAALVDAPDASARAEAWVIELLGPYGRENVEDVTVTLAGDQVVLRVVARNPSFLPPVIRRPMGLDRIDRTIRVRVEREI